MADERVCTKYRTETNSLHLALLYLLPRLLSCGLGLTELYDTTTNQNRSDRPFPSTHEVGLEVCRVLGYFGWFHVGLSEE